ncbi:hypothetical protein IRT45_21465 [Nocardia sp. BSTN01]|uniref:aromatic-ring hydroxylase C-terminal domain-containing protein n=1 Tax=Nocardia sp. BSTN01 TaxID=2783665 RepID=UPI00188FC958|nr:hypothetical protein [Nocardia sp. BSTN01]MBF4999716.1 hypothetical protein [Nocardia sp. BSTN01]
MGDLYQPTTRPGHRLPHAWLERDGNRHSTLDLVGHDRFVLLLGGDNRMWREAVATVAQRWAVTIEVAGIGGEPGSGVDYVDQGQWSALREIGEQGAILVRPDHHVAWRAFAPGNDPVQELSTAVSQVIGR